MLDGLHGATGMIGDDMQDSSLRMLLARRLVVQGKFGPAGSGGNEQRVAEKSVQGVEGDGSIGPVVVIVIGAEERGGEVEDAAIGDDQGRVQIVADGGMGVAGEVLPGAVEECAAQRSMCSSTDLRLHNVRLIVEDVVVIRCQPTIARQGFVEAQIARHGGGGRDIANRNARDIKCARLWIQGGCTT